MTPETLTNPSARQRVAVDEGTGALVLATELPAHAGPLDPRHGSPGDPLTFAGRSRELAASAWPARSSPEQPPGPGAFTDRSAVIIRPAPVPVLEALQPRAAR